MSNVGLLGYVPTLERRRTDAGAFRAAHLAAAGVSREARGAFERGCELAPVGRPSPQTITRVAAWAEPALAVIFEVFIDGGSGKYLVQEGRRVVVWGWGRNRKKRSVLESLHTQEW